MVLALCGVCVCLDQNDWNLIENVVFDGCCLLNSYPKIKPISSDPRLVRLKHTEVFFHVLGPLTNFN